MAEMHRYGVRVTTGPQNPSYALVYDSPSGKLLSFMVYPFSDLRLDATVALGVDRLAAPAARRVGLIGTGRLALGLLEATARVRSIESVSVFSRGEEHREQFAASAKSATGLQVTPARSAEAAVDGADIIITITSATEPALRGASLPSECLVVAAGLRNEVDEDVFLRASQIVTTSKVQEMNIHDVSDDWPLVKAMTFGAVSWDDVLELGDVVAENVKPAPGIRVFREAQGGFGDVALAALSYERAVALGRGTDVNLD
jgi:ornithine cyclodeaminase/alanine dehydrogenase-like protein (mu-crystallin family)